MNIWCSVNTRVIYACLFLMLFKYHFHIIASYSDTCTDLCFECTVTRVKCEQRPLLCFRMLFSNSALYRGCWTTSALPWGTHSFTCRQITSQTDRRTDSSHGRPSIGSSRPTSRVLWCVTWTGTRWWSFVILILLIKCPKNVHICPLCTMASCKRKWMVITANVHLLHLNKWITASCGCN